MNQYMLSQLKTNTLRGVVNLEGEEWKPLNLVFYGRLYLISTHGRIYSWRRQALLRGGKDSVGYSTVNMSIETKSKTMTVHRLVALTFIPNPKSYPVVNHLDLNKSNNHITNLEWCTHKHNSRHYFANRGN